jgi:hypothetical protein
MSSNASALLAISLWKADYQQDFEQAVSNSPGNAERPTQNCKKKVTREVKAKVRVAEDTPITFGDFEAALKVIVNGGAPGPSMATANTVKE